MRILKTNLHDCKQNRVMKRAEKYILRIDRYGLRWNLETCQHNPMCTEYLTSCHTLFSLNFPRKIFTFANAYNDIKYLFQNFEILSLCQLLHKDHSSNSIRSFSQKGRGQSKRYTKCQTMFWEFGSCNLCTNNYFIYFVHGDR